MSSDRQLARCVRSATHRLPLIKRSAASAAYGPMRSAKYQLSEAVRHTRALLDDLQSAQTALGWRDQEREQA